MVLCSAVFSNSVVPYDAIILSLHFIAACISNVHHLLQLSTQKIIKALEKHKVCVKFCFILEKTSSETFKMLQQGYEQENTQCCEWFNCFN